MKIVITADWHFGYPGKLNDLKQTFLSMLDYCSSNDISIILMLGDLTHDREHMTHDVSNTMSTLFDIMNKRGIQMITFIGNHDMFMRYKWSINAVKPFSKQLTYIDNVSKFEIDGRTFWTLPFIEHEPTYMKIVHRLSDIASDKDILLTHIGIASAKMNACFLVTNWSVVSFEDTKFERVYAGHFHCTQKVGSKAWYPGSPMPFRFDEGLVPHGFMVYDTSEGEHEFVELCDIMEETPADFITAESDDVEAIAEACKDDHIKIQLKDGDDADEIRKKLTEAGAARVVLVKPKDEISTDKPTNFTRTSNIFESWLEFDQPEHLDKDLLISLNKEVHADTILDEEDD